jgi:hypothetical protein
MRLALRPTPSELQRRSRAWCVRGIAPVFAQGDRKQQDKLEQAQRAEARVLVDRRR